MVNQNPKISVFDYLDYRKFLADYYGRKKELNRHFSYRVLSSKAGIASTGYFSEVLSGRRNLTRSKLPGIAQALGLNEKEQAFLSLLADFNHARNEKARQALYDQVVQAMSIRMQRLRESQWEYFSKWHHVAMREALGFLKVKDDCGELAAFLRPAITVPQAKAALRLLESLGLIQRDAEGCWRPTHQNLFSQRDESTALMVRSFQSEMMVLAQGALQSVDRDERDISCVTMSVSAKGLERVKEILKESHKRILDAVQADRGEDRVIQMNVQVFPLTRSKETA